MLLVGGRLDLFVFLPAVPTLILSAGRVGGGLYVLQLMHKQDPFHSVSLSFIFSVCSQCTTLPSCAVCIVVLCAVLPEVIGGEGIK